MAKKTVQSKHEPRFEGALRDSANKLRGPVKSSEYKHIALSLIFLKFVSDKFEERKAELVAEDQGGYRYDGVLHHEKRVLPAKRIPLEIHSTKRQAENFKKDN